jgi:non-ribosomal peptide synthetase component F
LWAAPGPGPRPATHYAEHHVQLDSDASDALRRIGRRHRLTLNTIVSGAWALLLGRVSGSPTVIFGATVNGRPADLDGAESMLGLFINTLPVRVRIDPAATAAAWLEQLQKRQAAARDYDYAPLSKVQRWSAVPGGRPLFESIVVFENNAGFGLSTEQHGTIEIRNVRPLIRNSLPLTLRCVPGQALSLQLLYDTSRFAADTVRGIADDLVEMLRDLPGAAGATLATLIARLDELEQARRTTQAQAFGARAAARLRTIKQQGRRPRFSQ